MMTLACLIDKHRYVSLNVIQSIPTPKDIVYSQLRAEEFSDYFRGGLRNILILMVVSVFYGVDIYKIYSFKKI